jgi:HEAT repeat protein
MVSPDSDLVLLVDGSSPWEDRRMRPFCLALLIGVLHFSKLTAEERIEPRYEGKPVTWWLERLRHAETQQEQIRARNAIEAFGVDAAPVVPGLVEMLEDLSPDYRTMIRFLLCKIGPGAKDAVPVLVKRLQGKTARDPEAVIDILGSIGPDAAEAVPVLTACLGNASLRDDAAHALCGIGPKARSAIPALGQAFRQARREDRYFTWVKKLHQLGPDAVPLLIEILGEAKLEDKCDSATALGQLGPAAQAATAHLTPLLKHQNPDLRCDAAIALWKIEKNEAVIPILVGLLQTTQDYPGAARIAAEALGDIGPCAKGALPALESYRRSVRDGYGSSLLQEEAAKAIKKIQGASQ